MLKDLAVCLMNDVARISIAVIRRVRTFLVGVVTAPSRRGVGSGNFCVASLPERILEQPREQECATGSQYGGCIMTDGETVIGL